MGELGLEGQHCGAVLCCSDDLGFDLWAVQWGRSGYEEEHYEEITTVLWQSRAVVPLLHHSR